LVGVSEYASYRLGKTEGRTVPVGFEPVGKPCGEADPLRPAHAYERAASPRRPPEGAPSLPDEPQ